MRLIICLLIMFFSNSVFANAFLQPFDIEQLKENTASNSCKHETIQIFKQGQKLPIVVLGHNIEHQNIRIENKYYRLNEPITYNIWFLKSRAVLSLFENSDKYNTSLSITQKNWGSSCQDKNYPQCKKINAELEVNHFIKKSKYESEKIFVEKYPVVVVDKCAKSKKAFFERESLINKIIYPIH